LARSAAYVTHRDQVSPLFKLGTAEPLIDQPPYIRALDELVETSKTAKASRRLTPAEAFAALCQGKCAMALAWPTAGQTADFARKENIKLGFAPLPVSRQAYRFATGTWEARDPDDVTPIPLLATTGRVAAVSTGSQDARRAGGLIMWLASRDVSDRVSAQSQEATLFRQSQVAKSSRWAPELQPDESRQYAETLAATLMAPRAMAGLNLPGRADYLAALDQAVKEALGGKPAAEALAAAAQRWREITQKHGNDAQRRALVHSLGQSE
jgi:ABC-type glycerol-3-phosphate transport system substrate-binding protein